MTADGWTGHTTWQRVRTVRTQAARSTPEHTGAHRSARAAPRCPQMWTRTGRSVPQPATARPTGPSAARPVRQTPAAGSGPRTGSTPPRAVAPTGQVTHSRVQAPPPATLAIPGKPGTPPPPLVCTHPTPANRWSSLRGSRRVDPSTPGRCHPCGQHTRHPDWAERASATHPGCATGSATSGGRSGLGFRAARGGPLTEVGGRGCVSGGRRDPLRPCTG